MKHELMYIGNKIIQNSQLLAEHVGRKQGDAFEKKLDAAPLPLEERIEYRASLIQLFGQALYRENKDIVREVEKWANNAGHAAIFNHLPLNDALQAITCYRTVIWDVFSEELEKNQFSAITMLDVSRIIDPLLDQISRIYGKLYDEHNQHLMKLAYTALEELSVPVVPIFDYVAVIPLVGAIDTHRAKLIMEVALEEGARLKLTDIILDVSGVPIIDTMVADQLLQIIKAIRLTGISVIITGVRPEIAQTIVSLGVSFGDIRTLASMKQALKELGFKKEK
ncbi:STAS domain-containing protein [Heyndrickxia acidicola]|uniref:STAS domain-containing protein n=1 Tax=Heyndrickxia acidicola TaxID=209389 RepID=A0ABU6MF76_9BACI|nr:STAS domain-containing protein [Heyndrickxia acidicola]MED1203333.1 STAS domain-containing protein [Heyndrickxia acidicola]